MDNYLKLKSYKMENSYFKRDAVEEVFVPVKVEEIEAEVIEDTTITEEKKEDFILPENYY